jgi:hypothetical protein
MTPNNPDSLSMGQPKLLEQLTIANDGNIIVNFKKFLTQKRRLVSNEEHGKGTAYNEEGIPSEVKLVLE